MSEAGGNNCTPRAARRCCRMA